MQHIPQFMYMQLTVKPRRKLKYIGYSLIELLIALFILSVGILATAQAQQVILQQTKTTYLESIAALQINNFVERLRANQDAAFRQRELTTWNQTNQILLPQTTSEFHCQAAKCTIVLQWFDRQPRLLKMIATA